jgi:hypothetical protein
LVASDSKDLADHLRVDKVADADPEVLVVDPEVLVGDSADLGDPVVALVAREENVPVVQISKF